MMINQPILLSSMTSLRRLTSITDIFLSMMDASTEMKREEDERQGRQEVMSTEKEAKNFNIEDIHPNAVRRRLYSSFLSLFHIV